MQQTFDVAVVGAGPIGGNIAKRIASENYNVAIFEQKKIIGEPLKCAGLVTPRVFDYVDFSEGLVVQNKIKGANIHSPSGHVLTIGGNKVHAYVIDRIKFDQEIINNAIKRNVEVFLDNKIISAQKQNNNIDLTTSQKSNFKCKLLIGADGPHSKIRDIFAFPRPVELLRGMGAEINGTNLNPDFVEIFVGNQVAPGFFAWIIPTNKEGSSARIGLCVSSNARFPPKVYFSNLFKNKYSSKFLEKTEITKYIGGIVPIGVLKKTFDSNVMLVGDSAAQVKPTSGGGIYPGLLCGMHCADTAVDSLDKNNFSASILKKYQKRWSADLGTDLNMGMKFRRIYKNLTDAQMDKYILKFQNPKIVDVISEYGDIDHPTKLVKPLLKKAPTLLRLITSVIKD